jgi:hypothetical protein
MGGLNAWRKFEPEKFTDAEVEQFKKEWRCASGYQTFLAQH